MDAEGDLAVGAARPDLADQDAGLPAAFEIGGVPVRGADPAEQIDLGPVRVRRPIDPPLGQGVGAARQALGRFALGRQVADVVLMLVIAPDADGVAARSVDATPDLDDPQDAVIQGVATPPRSPIVRASAFTTAP